MKRNIRSAEVMGMFPPNSIYIVGDAKTQQNNPITVRFGQFFIGFVVDKDSGEILGCGGASTLSITNEFIQSLFFGKSLLTDSNVIRKEVESRYFGSSQKAIVVAFKDAQKKFLNYQRGEKIMLCDITATS